MHRVLIEAIEDGWTLCRPGFAAEFMPDLAWAERAAASLAYEFHQRCGRAACAVVAAAGELREIARFG